VREHRLYQADWLMRFYGFGHEEIVPATAACSRSTSIPSWPGRSRHRERFPVDLNRAPEGDAAARARPGREVGRRVLQARRVGGRRLRAADLERMHLPLAKLLPFVVVEDTPARSRARGRRPGATPRAPPQQGSLFA
jgi:predicted DNA-binding helix-hairpin-helix protein